MFVRRILTGGALALLATTVATAGPCSREIADVENHHAALLTRSDKSSSKSTIETRPFIDPLALTALLAARQADAAGDQERCRHDVARLQSLLQDDAGGRSSD